MWLSVTPWSNVQGFRLIRANRTYIVLVVDTLTSDMTLKHTIRNKSTTLISRRGISWLLPTIQMRQVELA